MDPVSSPGQLAWAAYHHSTDICRCQHNYTNPLCLLCSMISLAIAFRTSVRSFQHDSRGCQHALRPEALPSIGAEAAEIPKVQVT